MEAIFTPEGKFYKGSNGKLKPSVTTVLGTIYPNYAAINWRKREIAEGRNPNESANRGTELHRLMEAYLTRELYPRDFLELSKDIAMYARQLLAGIDAITEWIGGGAIATEEYTEGEWYAGTIDAIMKGGYILDLKTTKSLKPWETDADIWWNATDREIKAWMQILGYAAAYEGIKGGLLLIVSPYDWVVKEQKFSNKDLDIWWGGDETLTTWMDPEKGENPEGPDPFRLRPMYENAIAKRREKAERSQTRSEAIKSFGF